jgi:hypothetical protein
MLPCRHRYEPYALAATVPNIVIDGGRNDNIVLSLSHWPKSGTPWPLKADTSVGIVFNYLDSPVWHRDVPVVTNDHFDEDGLIGLFCMIEPAFAQNNRDLLIDASRAGDFGTYRDRRAARLAFAISRLVDPALSPWSPEIIGPDSFKDYPGYCATVYRRLLERLQAMVEDIDAHEELWAEEDALLTASEDALERGEATLEEVADVDLAIVRVPEDWASRTAHRFTQHRDVVIHPMAVHNATRCNRITTLCGDRLRFDYRYESWVQVVNERPPLRVDLAPLAAALNTAEGKDAAWQADGVDQLTPGLAPEGGRSGLEHDRFLEIVAKGLKESAPAWDPYDPVP